MPVCSLRFDDSLTTIRTGANNGSTSTIGVGTYIVLGIQQWGAFTSETTITLPLTYTSINYLVAKTIRDCSYGKQFGASYLSVYNLQTSAFSNNYPGIIGSGGYYWVSIGR